MSWGAVVAGCGCAISLLACTLYTSIDQEDDPDAGAASSSGSQTGSSGGGGASSGNTASSASSSSSGGSSSGSSSSSASSASSSGGPALTEFEQTLLDKINDVRHSASPTPNPALSALYWDHEAAGACAQYTNTCESVGAPAGMVNGSGTSPLAATTIVQFLTSRQNDYDRDENKCEGGSSSECDLYKMVVKRSVVKVGCALTTCSGTDHWACTFSPVGSLADRPY